MKSRPSGYLKSFILTACALTLVNCAGNDWFGESEAPPLPGERVSILEMQRDLQPDQASSENPGFTAPPVWENAFWPQAGGYPGHAMQDLALNANDLKEFWTADIGSGTKHGLPLTAQPIVAANMVFTLDTEAYLSAFDIETGHRVWRTAVGDPGENDPVIGGGTAFAGGILYVTAGYDELIAVKPEDGSILWRARLPAASRAAPTVLDGRVFVATLNNSVHALNATDGTPLWEYTGIGAAAGLLGAASPAANADIVVPAFSSGELFALRIENGSVAWSDNLAGGTLRLGGLGGLADIRGLPVLDKGLVIAISFGGRIAAIDERTGTRVWQRDISGSETPWVAGNTVFVLSANNELVAMDRETGDIRWVTQMKRFRDEADHGQQIFWTGPVLAGGRLIVAGTGGRIAEINPENGKLLRQWSTGRTIRIPPIVAGNTLYLLSEDGRLSAYR